MIFNYIEAYFNYLRVKKAFDLHKHKGIEEVYEIFDIFFDVYNKDEKWFDINYKNVNLEILFDTDTLELRIGRVRTLYNEEWYYLKQRESKWNY